MIKLYLPRKISTNKIYAGVHWVTRNELKNTFYYSILEIKKQFYKPENYPVELRFDFYYSKRQLDASNASFMAKMIEDSIVKIGVLSDDSPKYIHSVTYTTNKSEEGKDYVIISY